MGDDTIWYGLQAFGLELAFRNGANAHGYAGAEWRGLMGRALAEAVCVRASPECDGCALVSQCAYPRLFKPMDTTAPPPFWLHGWRRVSGGWTVGVRWLGHEHGSRVDQWLRALSKPDDARIFGRKPVTLMAAHVPGEGKPIWRADNGFCRTPPPLPLAAPIGVPARVAVRMRTPLVSKHAGDPLYGALMTRLQRLVNRYGNGAPLRRDAPPWRCAMVECRDQRLPLARRVLAGRIMTLELRHIAPAAWQALNVGLELHAGGQAGLGCGHYEVLPATRAPLGPQRPDGPRFDHADGLGAVPHER